MVDISVPRTPTPQLTSSDERTVKTSKPRADAAFDSYTHNLTTTPPPPPNLSLTPPPSSQVPKPLLYHISQSYSQIEQSSLSSPTTNLGPSLSTYLGAMSNDVPTVDQINELNEPQLRDVLNSLISALSEARMSIAHVKLQHNLLSFEAKQAAERAAVEHDMTRREVEVLQAGSPILHNRAPTWADSRLPALTARQVELSLTRSRQFEAENLRLEHRLRQAKKIIKHLDGKNLQLTEDNYLLRQRIKQNRDHIEAMQSSGILSSGPIVQQTPKVSHRALTKTISDARNGSQDPFDALLFAGQVLNGETTSVPSTPSHFKRMRFPPGHTRGAHSLSSLPLTPDHLRPLTADNVLYTPTNRGLSSLHLSKSTHGTQLAPPEEDHRREDRDSTISASDNEEAYTDEDVPASQASQIATSMLRRFSGSTIQGTPMAGAPLQDKPHIQSRIIGKVTKPSVRDQGFAINTLKFSRDDVRATKKAKLEEATDRMGLGIGMWPSPS